MYLLPSGREARVATDSTFDIELTLTVATQVDRARSDVDVHEVVDDAALDMVQHPVDHVALAHIHDFDIREIPEGREQIHEANQQQITKT